MDRETLEKMCEAIELALETGKCLNGDELSKEALEMMYALAMGVHPDNINRDLK